MPSSFIVRYCQLALQAPPSRPAERSSEYPRGLPRYWDTVDGLDFLATFFFATPFSNVLTQFFKKKTSKLKLSKTELTMKSMQQEKHTQKSDTKTTLNNTHVLRSIGDEKWETGKKGDHGRLAGGRLFGAGMPVTHTHTRAGRRTVRASCREWGLCFSSFFLPCSLRHTPPPTTWPISVSTR